MDERKPSQRAPITQSASAIGNSLVSVTHKILDADRCSFLVDGGDHFDVVATTGREDTNQSYPHGIGIPSQAFDNGIACIIDDCLDTRSAAASQPGSTASTEQMRSLCCVPVGTIGLLLGEAYRPNAFDEAEKELLVHLVDHVLDSAGETGNGVRPVVDGGRRLDEASDLFEQIADILSHDVMNPLNVVSGNLALARETGDESHLQRAEEALDRVRELLDSVVLLARTGNIIEDSEPTDLEAATRTAWADIDADDATLDIVGSASIDADERALRQLLGNLLANSVTHAGPGVTVRVGPTDRGFFVEDDGPGIPAGQRRRVLDRGVSLGQDSSGLGLHIVRQIADAHGWKVTVTESESGGARFEFET